MDNIFEDITMTGLAVIVGIAIGVGSFIWRRRRNARCYPKNKKKVELLEAIRRMRIDGATYEQRLAYLRHQGYTRDVADELLGEAESSM